MPDPIRISTTKPYISPLQILKPVQNNSLWQFSIWFQLPTWHGWHRLQLMCRLHVTRSKDKIKMKKKQWDPMSVGLRLEKKIQWTHVGVSVPSPLPLSSIPSLFDTMSTLTTTLVDWRWGCRECLGTEEMVEERGRGPNLFSLLQLMCVFILV